MIVHCPTCQEMYDCTPGKYQCDCGTKFYVNQVGNVSLNKPQSREDIERTIAPRQHQENQSASDVTMPGRRERQPDGRFMPGDLILGRYKVLAELGQGGMGVTAPPLC